VASIRDEIVADACRRAGLEDEPLTLEGGTGAVAYADAVTAVLGLCVGKMAQSNNILVRWFIDPRNGSGKATPAFDRHAVPMVWDFVETNPFGGSVGDWTGPILETALKAFDLCVTDAPPAEVEQCDARIVGSGFRSGALIATDPPYYANIGYADLSDFFYLWIRPALRNVFPRLLGTVATPKSDELIATPYRHDGSSEQASNYFRTGFTDVFRSLSKKADERFPILIVYALKQAEEAEETVRSTGWEVFLGSLIDAGLSIVATWPVRTTTDTRMIGLGNNALASAIFVVGRRRSADATKINRAQFLRELREQLPGAYNRLTAVNIAPVDLAQAAIGPGMEVFSRYGAIIETDGSEMSVGTALGLINQVLDEAQVKQESEFDADTRWALAWFDQFGFSEGTFGVAETLCKAKNTSISGMVAAGIVAAKGGKVRLLKTDELLLQWDPTTDTRQTAWEATHYLIKALDGGEETAAKLLRKIVANAGLARDLSYRLYTISERRRWAKEALGYNALVQSWPEIARLAREKPAPATTPAQAHLI
jgi:putative DNA methylase